MGFSLAAGDFGHDGADDLAVGNPFDDASQHHRLGHGQRALRSRRDRDRRGRQSIAVPEHLRRARRARRPPTCSGGTSPPATSAARRRTTWPSAFRSRTSTGRWTWGSWTSCTGRRTASRAPAARSGASRRHRREGWARTATRSATRVTIADFGSGSRDDLAIGSSGHSVGRVTEAGAVFVVYGTADGLAADGAQEWTEEVTAGMNGPEHNDLFGSDVTSGDYDGNGVADLAAGVSLDDVGAVVNAGGAVVVFGRNARPDRRRRAALGRGHGHHPRPAGVRRPLRVRGRVATRPGRAARPSAGRSSPRSPGSSCS